MNLHEYQAKQLFRDYGIPVPNGRIAKSPAEAECAASALAGQRYIVKAQVHAGGRGKAGGVKLVGSPQEAGQVANELLGMQLVTAQTDAGGQPVNCVLVEETCDIAAEFYLGVVLDRARQRVVFIASTEGGVEIEEVAAKTPEKILHAVVDPLLGAMPYQGRQLSFGLGLNPQQSQQFGRLLSSLSRLFVEKDLSLVEVNPLVLTGGGDLLCLDGKINVDANALYRHAELLELRDVSQENALENRAAEWDLNYVALDGKIGCMVNGAGLAMATMDIIKLCGGEPANFLDVGGGATKERVAEALKIILCDDQVQGILVNIFGGIVRCDLIAEGIIAAVAEVKIEVPIVVRLEGTKAREGAELLNASGLNLIAAQDLREAASKVVAVTRGAQ